MCEHPQNEREECRLIVFQDSGSEILLSADSGAAGLPVISIPRYTRIAQSVSEAAQEQWNIAIYSLFSLPPRECPGETSRYQLAVFRSTTSIPPNMAWVTPRSLKSDDFREPQDYAAIQRAVELVQNHSKNPINGFFARPGWIDKVLGWTQAEARSLGLVPTGGFRQLNAGPTFSLIRMQTNDQALWLKAVGGSHIHEFRITMELSRLFPEFLPRILAKWDEQNAWLMIEAEGSHPDQNSARSVWVRVATALARLEIASMGRGLHLIDLGCRDVRVCTLRILLPPFVEAMSELMQQQTKKEPSPLSRNELSALRAQLGKIFLKLEELAIPNILTHLDFNPGNILVSRSSSTFLDWAEASVGPCFLTLQLLLEHVQRLIPDNPLLAPSIISAYRHEWSNCESSEALDEMLSASPLVAVSAYALNLWSSHNEKREMDKRTAGYLRSLTRRIKREAEVFTTRRTLCAR